MPTKRLRNPFTNPLEKSEQAKTRNLLKAVGFCLWSLDQWRATGQTPGLYDTYAVHPGVSVALWLDSKRRKGSKVSVEQEEFALVHEAAMRARIDGGLFGGFGMHNYCGIPATVIGSYEAAEEFVVKAGLGSRYATGQFVAHPMLTPAFHRWCARMEEAKQQRAIARVRKPPRTRRA